MVVPLLIVAAGIETVLILVQQEGEDRNAMEGIPSGITQAARLFVSHHGKHYRVVCRVIDLDMESFECDLFCFGQIIGECLIEGWRDHPVHQLPIRYID